MVSTELVRRAVQWQMALCCAVVLMSLIARAGASTPSTLSAPNGLKCEHRVSPLALAAREPRFSWLDHAASASSRGVHQSAYRIEVAATRAALDRGDEAWDSGEVASSQTIEIAYAGKPLLPLHAYCWRVMVWDAQHHASAWSAPATWTMAPDTKDWTARWIADAPDAADKNAEGRVEGDRTAMPIFRRAFKTRKPIARALLYVTGMGQFEVHLNGAKAGDAVLTPGWTDYRKTVLYDTYDVTSMIRQGDNAIGVLLGNGMYNVRETKGRYTKLENSFGQPKCLVMLRLQYADGGSEWVKSDGSWKTAKGPVRFSSTYGGEDYDATAEMRGWDAPGFDDAAWQPALEVAGPGGALMPEAIPPVRVMQQYAVTTRRILRPGVTVYDLGQNFAGWPEITVRGLRGSKVKMIPGELLHADGSVTQQSSGGPQWFTYTLSGSGAERWQPRFSYYGFRYVQVEVQGPSTGAARPELVELKGEAVHTSAEETGNFQTADSLLQRTHMLILQSMRNNIVSVLTDCPHREKLGWLEESHLLGSALNYDFNLEQNYEKISDDMVAAQDAKGMVAEIAPRYVVFGGNGGVFDDSPEWGSAAVLDPWIAYQRYGDLEDLQQHYASMRAYVEYLGTRAKQHIITYGLGDWYDIGLGEPGFSKLTTAGVTATAIYYQDLQVMQKTAALLGKADDAAMYTALARLVRDAFNAKFYDPAARSYDHGSQTANAMPLVLDMVPDAEGRKGVLDRLVADVHAHGDHVTAGDIGYHYVVDALLEGGRSDVLMAMLSRTDSPSYGYQLAQGATSLTEAWDANPKSSQDHFMLGDAEEWFYRGLGGVSVDMARPVDEQITIHPAVVRGVPSAEVRYASVKGEIRSAWKHAGGRLVLDVAVPPNTVATVYLPAAEGARVTESGAAVAHARGVTFVRREDDAMLYHVESGVYHFAVVD